MPLILGTNSIKDTGFNVANSCRFSGDTALHKDNSASSAPDADKFTISFWYKKTTLVGSQDGHKVIMISGSGTQGDGSDHYFQAYFKNDDTFRWQEYDDGSTGELIPTQKFRDPTAWYHFVLRFDSTLSTANDRMRMYVNGTQITSFATRVNPSQNDECWFNYSSAGISIGGVTSQFCEGYLAEFVGVDGQSLGPDSFGEFDEDSPQIWKPINVSGITLGTHGFYLDFEDGSNLGNDAGGGTDFTEVNLAAADQATDTPTNNFCVINSAHNYWTNSTYSQGGCQTLTGATNYFHPDVGTFAVASGKWYWEIEVDADESGAMFALLGVKSNIMGLGTGSYTGTKAFLGMDAGDYGYYGNSGSLYNGNGTTSTSYGNAYVEGNIIGVALNLDDNELKFYINGTVQNSGTAISITAPAITVTRFYYPAVGAWGNGTHGFKCNFGGCPAYSISSGNADGNGYGNFEYAVPSGFYALCTKNLAEFG